MSRLSATRRLAAVLALALVPGCTISEQYIHNRVMDLTDVVRVHIFFGKSIGIEAGVTQFLALGFMYENNCWACGWGNRHFGTWNETINSWGLLLHNWSERVKGISRYSGSYGWYLGNRTSANFSHTGPNVDLLNLRASVALFIGADAELSIGQAFDFVVGFLTFDPAGDDTHK